VPGDGGSFVLGRERPLLAGPGGSPGAGLADPHVSRQALCITRRGERWTFERPAGSSRCLIDGREVFAERVLGTGALRAGVRLLLAHGVLLLLRLVPASAGEPAPAVPGLLGDSPWLRALRRQVTQLAPSAADVLLCGPTGTGKELVARALHAGSARAAGPLLCVNVAAIPPELAAAQLFGASRGAYTGAEAAHRGFFEQAAGGTLFLDEIGDAPRSLQPQLLRALEEREVQVVGGPIRRVDVRVISATDAVIDDENASFSRALRHRLGALELRLQPLAAHPEDIGTLAVHYLGRAFAAADCAAYWEGLASAPQRLAACAELFDSLLAYHWPGNIRELANVARQLALGCGEQFELPEALRDKLARPPPAPTVPEAEADGDPAVSENDFAAAWEANDFEVAATARALGLSRPAVYRRVRDLPACRLAGDIPRDELLATLAEARGDLEAAARRLCVSQSGLRARLRAAGDSSVPAP
jgi:two-component system nitrogen regulation response regulator GlnG